MYLNTVFTNNGISAGYKLYFHTGKNYRKTSIMFSILSKSGISSAHKPFLLAIVTHCSRLVITPWKCVNLWNLYYANSYLSFFFSIENTSINQKYFFNFLLLLTVVLTGCPLINSYCSSKVKVKGSVYCAKLLDFLKF